MGQSRHIVVIGAGTVGICCALYLQRDGFRVTVLDERGPGEGASKGNAGIIATNMCMPVATPEVLKRAPFMVLDSEAPLRIRWPYLLKLAPWLGRFALAGTSGNVKRISRELASLLAPAIESYKPLLDDASAHDLFRYAGWLHVFENEANFRALNRQMEFRRACGINVEALEGPQLRDRVPELSPSVRHGYFFPDCANTVDPKRLVERFARAFAENGGTLLRGRAHGFSITDGQVTGIVSDMAVDRPDAVVVAAGAWSKPLATELGCTIPLETERGYHLMLRNPGIELKTPLICGDTEFGITPMLDGIRLAGTVELASLNASPDWRRSRMLYTLAKRVLPGLRDDGATQWMGFRPSLPDSKPVIGRSPRVRNAYLAFGHGHLGITLAAVTGRMILALVKDQVPVVDPKAFEPGRF